MKRNGKWEKVLMMVLILSAFILIILLAAQLGNVKQRDWKPEDETQESTEEQSQEESLTQESQTETTEESTPIEETESFEEEEQGYIIIGDSHIVVTEEWDTAYMDLRWKVLHSTGISFLCTQDLILPWELLSGLQETAQIE